MFKKFLSFFKSFFPKPSNVSFLEIVNSKPLAIRTSRSIHATTDKRTNEYLKIGHEDIQLIFIDRKETGFSTPFLGDVAITFAKIGKEPHAIAIHDIQFTRKQEYIDLN